MQYPVYLSSFGGSGENGRNCHCIEVNDEIILLDCGVKREIIDGQVGFYPHLTEDIVKRIKCVFLSHCHEDHVASLPLLYHLGYTGKVYATKETILETPGFMNKWATFVGKQNGQLPFDKEDASKVQFEEIELGKQVVEGLNVTVGRTGHALGSTWYVFDFDGKRVLYTGDMVAQSATLATDLPEHCEAAIMNGAYAGKQLSQSQQYEKLLGTIKETYAQGGSVMLPIPPKGRGIDIMLFLDERLEDARIFVEKAVVTSMNALAQKKAWLKDGLCTILSDKITVISSDEEREAALKAPQGIYITGDGMITTDVSMIYYEALKSSENNAILITGHAATGTIGAGVLDDTFRKEHGVNAKADKIIFKVHLDDNDIYDLTTHIQAKKIVLFHADTIHNTNITHRLAENDVLVTTLAYPSKLEM